MQVRPERFHAVSGISSSLQPSDRARRIVSAFSLPITFFLGVGVCSDFVIRPFRTPKGCLLSSGVVQVCVDHPHHSVSVQYSSSEAFPQLSGRSPC